jgi:hypothetical protein
LDPVRIGIQPKMLDQDPYHMNVDPQPCYKQDFAGNSGDLMFRIFHKPDWCPGKTLIMIVKHMHPGEQKTRF